MRTAVESLTYLLLIKLCSDCMVSTLEKLVSNDDSVLTMGKGEVVLNFLHNANLTLDFVALVDTLNSCPVIR